MTTTTTELGILAVSVLVVVSLFAIYVGRAEPEGANVVYESNSTKNITSPGVRNDSKGTITVLTLTAIQQNIKWKAYVGNVSGTLVLRDADQYSIYEWPALGAPQGEVFITRNNTVDWGTIGCVTNSSLSTEQVVLGHGPGALDNINNTFDETIHAAMTVGTTDIGNSTCRSQFTWVDSAAQTASETADYQEILLSDGSDRLIYTTIISQDANSYKNDGSTTYDFQAIVPDYTGAEQATYYFFVEIEG